MMRLILGVAQRDDRIRAVYLNGSRANPAVPRDEFQDYDVVYVVTDGTWFVEHRDWIEVFGDTAIVQEPDPPDSNWFGWLMLFRDGNRIDLHVESLAHCADHWGEDSLTVPLLDKDGILPTLPPPSERSYRVPRPSEEAFHACCNEFWWCLQNVAKGIRRDQLSYAMWMYHTVVGDALRQMLGFYVGSLGDFTNAGGGMAGKYYKKHLPPEWYALLRKSYPTSDYDQFWEAIEAECDLFHRAASHVAGRLGYAYRQHEEDGMRNYLESMKSGLL